MLAFLGIPDIWVSLSIILSILTTIICAIYGIYGWNKGDDSEPIEEIKKWVEDDDKIEEEF